MKKRIVVLCTICAVVVLPVVVQAKIEFTEIMYDPTGSDAGREWIEVRNASSESVDVSALKLFEEGVHHGLKPIAGGTVLVGGQYAVIADDSVTFMLDWPAYSGVLFDSSFSLKNTGEALVLRNKDGDQDSIVFDPAVGGGGDGNSLRKQLSAVGLVSWGAALPSPGGEGVAAVGEVGSIVEQAGSSASSTLVSSSNEALSGQGGDIASTDMSIADSASSGMPLVSVKQIPVEPQIFGKISGKSEVFAGVETTFSAQGWGLKKQPLQNARYIWNFGDGQVAEGQYILHAYAQPGTYEIFLEVASDIYSATDRLQVVARMPQLVMNHSNEAITIKNHDTAAIDLFGLRIVQDGRADFYFPEHSMVAGGSAMTIDATRFSQGHAEVKRADEVPITLRYLNDRMVATSTRLLPRQGLSVPVSVPTKTTGAAKGLAKPKKVDTAAQKIDRSAVQGQEQVISLDTTAKERQLHYYGATVGVLIMLAFAWWYLLR